ncbi:phage tail tip fiber protein, partial [Janthinobacterium psychrotolerans]
MSALLGERDRLIMNTVPRYATPMDRALMLTASATMFEVSAAGVPTPETITFSALMLGAVGDITFSSEPAVSMAVANGNAVLNYADMSASIVTVTASTVIEGVTYHARQTVAKTQALDLTPPPAPTGLAATGHPATITLAWNAAPANYSNLSHTEVWRAPTNNFAQAALVGRADGREYTDPVGPGAFRYYWIRYVSRAAIPGPYNASSGTVGASDVEVEHLLQVLTQQITESQLYADLGAKIDLIEPTRDAVADLEQVFGDTVAAAASAAQAAQAAATALLDAAKAEAAAGGASQYASQANQSATNASTSAGTASTSAGQSSQAATAAGDSAAAAESAASTAANAAGEAGASASAALISKNAAAGSVSAAGVQAAASTQSAIEAKAARDAASESASASLQSAGSASASSTEAGTAASQAANSALLAAESRNAAGGSAAAAAGSAGTAGAKSTEAGQSAEAARVDRVAAQAAFSQAAGAAQAASGSAETADARATAAGQSALAASNAATTAGTAAGQAGSYLQQVAQSATNADGSAQAAASYLQQAQAVLADPITGLVASYAAVSQQAIATATSLGQVQAKYAVRVDAGGVAGGFELIGGGGAIDFGVRATTFYVASPAGSGIASAVPFIVRTTETIIGGVTIPIGMYVADAFIQNASITNAKIGGDIWASNFVAGQSGWRLYRSGDMEINNLRARGAIAGGAFTGADWPAAGGGFYLGPDVFRIGSQPSGKYFEVNSSGDVHSPQFNIDGGLARFSGELAGVIGTFSLVRSPTRAGPAGNA